MTERHRLPNQQRSAPAMTAAEMIERAATTSIATHRTMRHLVRDIRKHFAHADEAYGKFNAARIKLGQDLLEARARVEDGEEGSGSITWWQWFEKNFPQSRSTAEKAMQIAAAENPQAAEAAVRARNAIANRAYRARQSVSRALEPPSRSAPVSRDLEPSILTIGAEVLPPDPGEEQLIDQIIELFKRLSRSAQVRCAVRQRKVIRGDA
jgi:hypothetical protein